MYYTRATKGFHTYIENDGSQVLLSQGACHLLWIEHMNVQSETSAPCGERSVPPGPEQERDKSMLNDCQSLASCPMQRENLHATSS